MALIDPSHASTFLMQYKRLLVTIAAKPMEDINDYIEARNKLYKKEFNKCYAFDSSYNESFVLAVRSSIYGMFIYAKKYKQGYAFRRLDNTWLCVKALTTPLEELIPDWIVIDTAILPYEGFLVCDGLIADRKVLIGPNMIKSMTQELKTERKKWLQER